MEKYLFICQHNFTRSKYFQEFFRGFLKGRNLNDKIIEKFKFDERKINFEKYL